MRALVKEQAGPGLRMVDRPEPALQAGQVKIRVLRAGLCGTDLHLQSWDDWAAATVRPPVIIGHEFCGEVVDVASDVVGVECGDRVSGEGHLVCGTCRNCRAGRRHLCINTIGLGIHRDGAFAEFVVLPASNVWVHPADLDPDLGAIFDPLGNAVHSVLTFPMPGEDVLITGAGPIGVMSAALARHVGARYVVATDKSPYRLALAEAAGADLAVDVGQRRIADAMADLGMREGFDIGLEMSGVPSAVEEMLATMNHGGRVAMLGLPHAPYSVDWGRIVTHMITIKGIYGREMYDTWYSMGAMLGSSQTLRSRVASVITHRFPAEEWPEAFETARSGQCGKVVMVWET